MLVARVKNTRKPVWQPGSAWTRWGAYSSPSHPQAALRGWDAGRKSRGKGEEVRREKERVGEGRREENGEEN